MPAELRSLLRGWMKELTLDPLNPADPNEHRYVPLEESGKGAVDRIHSTIDLELDTTTQLLSGPRGSGKTTELYRLKGRLEDDGFTVAMVDILQFVNQAMPIDVADFLIAVALGVGEQLPAPDPGKPGFGRRFRELLRRLEISFTAGPVSISASKDKLSTSAFGASIDADLKRDLKGSQVFVDELRAGLASRIPQLRTEVGAYIRELVGQNRVRNPQTRGVVVIVDSLEKLRGTLENDEHVQTSIEALFVQHADKLRFSSHHTVYTVPTYLLLSAPGSLPYNGPVRPVPIPQLRNRQGEVDTHSKQTLAEMVEIVSRRLPWPELLGELDLLHRVINASGGHLRDIFLILREAITSVYGRDLVLPMSAEHLEEVLNSVGHGFSNVTREQADFLRRVVETQGVPEPADDEVQLMARLMDTHMLLGHMNGHDWYEVHPLARRAIDL